MERKDLRRIIRESLSAGVQEGSDGEYMAQQNLNTISMSLEAIQEKIDYSKIPDWVDDKISKIAENMKQLRSYYESQDKENYNKEINDMNGDSTGGNLAGVSSGGISDIIGVVSEEEGADFDEGMGRDYAIGHGTNAKPKNYPNNLKRRKEQRN